MMKSKILWWLFALVLILAPTFYNGFPLVYSDSGTYISSGMEWFVPKDRPIFYGLFLGLTSMHVTLWLPVIIQSCILFFALTIVLSSWGLNSKPLSSILVLLLTGLTSMGWYAGQLMPDIFAAILLLLLSSSFLENRKWWIYPLIALCALVHTSHILIYFSMVVLFSFLWRKKISKEHPISRHWINLILVILIQISTNGVGLGKFQLGNGSQVYLLGRMADIGVLESYLDQNCESEVGLCELKDKFPMDSRTFIWKETLNGYDPWMDGDKLYSKAVFEILSTPRYLFKFCKEGALSCLSMLTENAVGSGLQSDWYREASSPPFQQVEKHFPGEMQQYLNGRQNGNLWGGGLSFKFLSIIQYLLIIFSIALLLYYWTSLPHPIRMSITIIIVGIILNAVIVGAFANPYDRLQSRVSWLFVFIGLWIFLSRIVPQTSSPELFEP